MGYKYSHIADAFYPTDMLDAYVDLPDDLVDVDEPVYQEVLDARSQGRAYVVAPDGGTVSVSPDIAYDFDSKSEAWVLNKTKQAAMKDAARKAAIPQVVTIRQAKRALLQVELLDDVEAIMASPAVDRATKIDWESAIEVKREWVEQSGLMLRLGLDDEKLDDLFVLAASL